MNRLTMLLLAFLLVLSTVLEGCAGLFRFTPKEDAAPAMNMTFTRVFGNYMIRSPEPMKIALADTGWSALELYEDADSKVVTFYRDSGRVSVSVSATTPQKLRTDGVKDYDPADPDSMKIWKMLEKEMLDFKAPAGDSSAAATIGSVVRTANRGHVCMSDSIKNKCTFVIVTEKGNWVISGVVAPKDVNAEELGTRTLSMIDNAELSDYEKHATRVLKSYGVGMSIWYNWEDEDANPDRDFSKALLIRRGGIIDFGGRLAFNYSNLLGFNYGDAWHNWGWRYMTMFGFRIYMFSAFVSPFIGAHIGLGMQYDDHYSKFADKFAINLAGDVDAGLVICRYCKYQVELGASYDAVEDGFFNDQVFGAFNFYAAVNY